MTMLDSLNEIIDEFVKENNVAVSIEEDISWGGWYLRMRQDGFQSNSIISFHEFMQSINPRAMIMNILLSMLHDIEKCRDWYEKQKVHTTENIPRGPIG